MASRNFSKRQHYIPQFYLKAFSIDQKHLYIYDREKGEQGEIRYQTTEKIAFENHFYTYRTHGGGKENLEDLFSFFESEASSIINQAYHEREITFEGKEKLALFISLLYARTPYFKRTIEESHLKVREKLSRMMFEIIPGEEIRRFFKEKKEKELTDEEIDDLVNYATDPKRSKIEFEYSNEYWIQFMLKLAVDIAPAFLKMNWFFLFADQKYAFITNDRPVTLLPPEDYNPLRGVGFITPGARKYVPLKSDFCLLLADLQKEPLVESIDISKNIFRPMNEELMLRSERFSFSSHKGKLEKLVKDLNPYNKEPIEKILVS